MNVQKAILRRFFWENFWDFWEEGILVWLNEVEVADFFWKGERKRFLRKMKNIPIWKRKWVEYLKFRVSEKARILSPSEALTKTLTFSPSDFGAISFFFLWFCCSATESHFHKATKLSHSSPLVIIPWQTISREDEICELGENVCSFVIWQPQQLELTLIHSSRDIQSRHCRQIESFHFADPKLTPAQFEQNYGEILDKLNNRFGDQREMKLKSICPPFLTVVCQSSL